MAFRLIYHRVPVESGDSPFVLALREVALGEALDLAAPYLSLARLQELADLAPRWRVITDMDAWLRAYPAQARDIVAFVRTHESRFRDCRGLHAKVAIGTHAALMGSANFTDPGLGKNHEVSALIHDSAHCDELRAWFESIWDPTFPPHRAKCVALARALSSPQAQHALRTLETAALPLGPSPLRVNKSSTIAPTHQATLDTPQTTASSQEHPRMVAAIRALFASEGLAHRALDCLRDAITAAEISSRDPRLHVSTDRRISQHTFRVTLGQRYVASVGHIGTQTVVCLMLSEALAHRDDVRALALHVGNGFKGGRPMFYARIPLAALDTLASDVWDDWRACIAYQLTRAQSSPYRSKHGFRQGTYDLIMDPTVRADLVRQALRGG
ncbi:MAG: phospholipase D-like domain-containing protein [Deltaproteobacteria bacterium]|nr:phospholipase D-like domain-containing protein [Deltaproteobacteria bacterium]